MNLSLDLEDVKIDNKRDVYLFGGLFLIILLSVFHVIDYDFPASVFWNHRIKIIRVSYAYAMAVFLRIPSFKDESLLPT